jgi:hypothetical protein
MTGRDLDFSRYAPERPAVVWQQADRPQPGELAILAGHARNAASHIWRCFVIALIVIWRRFCWRAADFYRHVLHSAQAAWTVAGLGWGFGITFPLILFLTR